MATGFSEPTNIRDRINKFFSDNTDKLSTISIHNHSGRIARIATSLGLIDPVSIIDDLLAEIVNRFDNILRIIIDNEELKINTRKSYIESLRTFLVALSKEGFEKEKEELTVYIAALADKARNDTSDRKVTQINQFLESEINTIESFQNKVLSIYRKPIDFQKLATVLLYIQVPLREDAGYMTIYKEDPNFLTHNYMVKNGDSEVLLKLNKTKTIPKVYERLTIHIGNPFAEVVLRKLGNENEKTLWKGPRSKHLSLVLEDLNINCCGGPVNWFRRFHSNFNRRSNILKLLGHNANTHGKNYFFPKSIYTLNQT
jgi:hypothetical protein